MISSPGCSTASKARPGHGFLTGIQDIKKDDLLAVIFNIQRFSIQDGPGIRTTVFFKGCPLRCRWCSNPESQYSFPEIAFSNSLCNKCGHCVEACDVHAVSIKDGVLSINRKICTGCGKCAEVCAPKALKLFGKEMTVEEVFREAVRDKPFYENSRGGITASGGEALLQVDFIVDLFKLCKNTHIHTCLDTCGYVASDAWAKILPHTDLILFDIKHIDPSIHQTHTGKSNQKILQNLKIVADSEVPVIIRIPVIPGINDSSENIRGIARYVANLHRIKEVNLLPYHRFGTNKYKMLDRRYKLSELTAPEHAQIEKLLKIFESLNLNCSVVS
jgi:pyruvate formate lyase activating enzyme